MRVAVVTHYFPTSADPWAGHTAVQTLRLLAQRCQVHVFYPEAAYPARLKPAGTHTIDRTWAPAGIDVSYLPYPALPLLSRPLNGMVIARSLLPHVRQFRPDVLLNYVIYPDGYAAIRIGRSLGIPVIVTAIGSDLNRISDPLCGMLTRATLRQADRVMTVSHDLARTAQALGANPARLTAALNGIDTSIFYPRDREECRRALHLDPEAEILLYVGRLDLRKGLIELVEAVARLALKRPRVRCYILGDGAVRSTLVETIAKFNAGNVVTLVPSQNTAEVALWMGAANLVTLPSYNEGCPNVVLEALGAGRPIVATRVGGIPEIMDESCGRLIPPREVTALTEALEQVLNHPWDAQRIAAEHNRSWANLADEVYALLQQAVRTR